jgi:hypothetical protein
MLHAFMGHLKGRVCVFMCFLLERRSNSTNVMKYLEENKTYLSCPGWNPFWQCLHCSNETLAGAEIYKHLILAFMPKLGRVRSKLGFIKGPSIRSGLGPG